MAHLYLIRRWIQSQQSEALLGAAASNSIVSGGLHLQHINPNRSASLMSSNYVDYHDGEDLEMLFEAYFMQLDGTRNKILSVYGYRMSLWAEHLGKLEDSFRQPHTVDCVKLVNKIAKQNWKALVADDGEMSGHLMRYPVEVSRCGKVGPLPGHESFPDVGGKVLGSRTNLPDALTT